MSQFTALIVTRSTDGTATTYTLTHQIESRLAMFNYILKRFTKGHEQIETITILEEER